MTLTERHGPEPDGHTAIHPGPERDGRTWHTAATFPLKATMTSPTRRSPDNTRNPAALFADTTHPGPEPDSHTWHTTVTFPLELVS